MMAVWAVAGPGIVWLAAAAAILAASLGGYRALAAPADLTLSEAAAIRDEAEVLRQIRAGADPDARGLVRRGMISDPEYLMTPLEAAIAAGHGEVVRLLLRNGAVINDANFSLLFCLAEEHGTPDIVSFLNEHAPSGIAVQCDGIRLPL